MKQIVSGLKLLTTTLLVTMLCVLVWQVFSRYVLKQPSTVTEELSRMLLMWLGTLAATLGCILRKHMFFETILENATEKRRNLVLWFADANVMLFGVILTIGGGVVVKNAWMLGQKTPVLGMPVAYIYTVLPICGILIALGALVREEVCN